MIPRLAATQFKRFMESGRTFPALCGCSDESGKPAGEYVVKLRGAVDGREAALVNELLGAVLASYFRLAAPEPAVIFLDPKFTDLVSVDHPSRREVLQASAGWNFGTKHMPAAGTWPVDMPIPWDRFDSAVEIFAFDALIQNPDRRFNNPNVLADGSKFYVFDHEVAFSFLRAIPPTATPWIVDQERYLEHHVFYRKLKSKPIELEGFTSRLAEMPDAFLDSFVAEVPHEWDNQDCVTRIVAHLRTVRDHATEFAESIRRVLR
jgi:hypothetical protein